MTTYGDGAAYFAVGGSAETGVVAYGTFDNVVFHRLVDKAKMEALDESVELVAGGQPGMYPRHQVVSAQLAVQGAQAFAQRGELSDRLGWD